MLRKNRLIAVAGGLSAFLVTACGQEWPQEFKTTNSINDDNNTQPGPDFDEALDESAPQLFMTSEDGSQIYLGPVPIVPTQNFEVAGGFESTPNEEDNPGFDPANTEDPASPVGTIRQPLEWGFRDFRRAGTMNNFTIVNASGLWFTVQIRPLSGAADMELWYDGNVHHKFASRFQPGRAGELVSFVSGDSRVVARVYARQDTSYLFWVETPGLARAGDMVKPVAVPDYTSVCNGTYATLYRDHYDGREGAYESDGKHPGVDIGVRSGTNVRAVFDGTVTVSTDHNGWGGYIVIEHNGVSGTRDTIYSAYAHLRARFVNRGERVRRGQVIGSSGGGAGDPHRGTSDNSHLHFQIDRRIGIGGDFIVHPYWPGNEMIRIPDTDNTVLDRTLNPMAFVQARD